MGRLLGDKAPKIYHVNWFLKSSDGKFLWPGFGDNIHVLKWVFERCEGVALAKESGVGLLPKQFDGSPHLFDIDCEKWREEVEGIEHYFKLFGNDLPSLLYDELNNLKRRFNG